MSSFVIGPNRPGASAFLTAGDVKTGRFFWGPLDQACKFPTLDEAQAAFRALEHYRPGIILNHAILELGDNGSLKVIGS